MITIASTGTVIAIVVVVALAVATFALTVRLLIAALGGERRGRRLQRRRDH
jgi:hypothetical protein